MDYKRNIPLLYIYSILIKRPTIPIIIIYYLLYHLSYTQIGILAAVTSVISMLTEVHGGIFADINGKKLSLLISSIFGFLTMFFLLIGDSFNYFLIAAVTYGFSWTFLSGTRTALLYDTLLQLKLEAKFKKYSGRMLMVSHFINALILLGIPVLYVMDEKLPFVVGLIFFVTSFIVASFIKEPKVKQKKGYTLKVVEAVKEIKVNIKVSVAIIFAMITAGFVFMSSTFHQPLLLISGLNVIYFGVVWAFMRVLMGIGAEVTHRLEKFFKLETLLFIGAVMMVLSFLGLWKGVGLIIILGTLIIKFAEGFNRIILEDEINKNITSTNRTTILSIISLSRQAMSAGLIIVFGIVADFTGVQVMYKYILTAFIVCMILAFAFMRNSIPVKDKK